MITPDDLKTLLEKHPDGFLGGDAEAWLRDRGIEEETFRYIVNSLEQTFKGGVAEMAVEQITSGEPTMSPEEVISTSIQAALGVAFTIGWDLCVEYGDDR